MLNRARVDVPQELPQLALVDKPSPRILAVAFQLLAVPLAPNLSSSIKPLVLANVL
jgi:hypothetical protein